MKKLLRKVMVAVLAVCGTVSLSACWTVEDAVTIGTYDALQNAQKHNGMLSKDKSRAQEIEQLKKQGKCPTCRGAGKTPDGRYTCATCNGTGKYQAQN